MGTDGGPTDPTTLSADEAFAILGDETRLQILQALGEAGEPLSYAELFDDVEYDDSSNFHYHLNKLLKQFVRKTDEGYELRLTGKRVVEAVLSGVVTDDPVGDRSPVDMACPYCGSRTEMGYFDEVIVVYCAECTGQIEKSRASRAERWPIPAADIVGYVRLPPAGVYDRTPTEILEAAQIRTLSEIQSIAREVCPRCSADLDRSIDVCEDHHAGDRFCSECGHQFGVRIDVECTNCIFETVSPFPTHALANTDLIEFMIDHGIDPFAPTTFHLSACEEEFVSTEPFEARYTFTADNDMLTLTVDDDLSVVDATRHDTHEAEK